MLRPTPPLCCIPTMDIIWQFAHDILRFPYHGLVLLMLSNFPMHTFMLSGCLLFTGYSTLPPSMVLDNWWWNPKQNKASLPSWLSTNSYAYSMGGHPTKEDDECTRKEWIKFSPLILASPKLWGRQDLKRPERDRRNGLHSMASNQIWILLCR